MTDQTEKTPDISVVIPSYRSGRTIGRCLQALAGQDFSGQVEIIVVDSSDDGTAEFIGENFPQVRLIKLSARTPQGQARNIGTREARAEAVVFLDADCIPSPTWLRQHLQALQHHPLVGGSIGNGSRKSLVAWASYFLEFSGYTPSPRKGTVNCIISGNLSGRKSIFLEHPFPQDLWRGEDIAFLRALSGRYRFFYDGSARVDHDHPYSLQEFFRKQALNGRSAAVVWPKTGKHRLLYQHRWLAVLTPFWRLGLTFWRSLRDTPGLLPVLMLVSPLVLAGACAWAWGFIFSAPKRG